MPIQRFRTHEEARRALWHRPDEGDLAARMRRLWAFAARLCPSRAPRGLRRFRSIEDAARDRATW